MNEQRSNKNAAAWQPVTSDDWAECVGDWGNKVLSYRVDDGGKVIHLADGTGGEYGSIDFGDRRLCEAASKAAEIWTPVDSVSLPYFISVSDTELGVMDDDGYWHYTDKPQTIALCESKEINPWAVQLMRELVRKFRGEERISEKLSLFGSPHTEMIALADEALMLLDTIAEEPKE